MAPGDTNNHTYKNPRLRVALIAFNQDGKVLLLEHTRPHGIYHVLPGGGVDPGERLEDTLVREIQEELDADSEISNLVAVGELITPDRHVVDFFYMGKIISDGPFRLQAEEGITEAEWYDLSQLSEIDVRPAEIVQVIKGLGVNSDCGECGINYLGQYKIKG